MAEDRNFEVVSDKFHVVEISTGENFVQKWTIKCRCCRRRRRRRHHHHLAVKELGHC